MYAHFLQQWQSHALKANKQIHQQLTAHISNVLKFSKRMHALKIMPYMTFIFLPVPAKPKIMFPRFDQGGFIRYILKMFLIPSTLFQSSLKLHAAEPVSRCKSAAAAPPERDIRYNYCKGLGLLKLTNVAHLRPLTSEHVIVSMKTSLP